MLHILQTPIFSSIGNYEILYELTQNRFDITWNLIYILVVDIPPKRI